MKIRDIISEGLTDMRPGARDSVPDLELYPELNNNNNPYLAYRFGVALAVAPEAHMNVEGPTGSDFVTIGYTDADKAIIDGAKKLIGVTSEKKTTERSKEGEWVNKQSPVQPKGPVKRKGK